MLLHPVGVHTQLSKAIQEATTTASDLNSSQLEFEQATASNSSLQQRLQAKQQELQQLQQEYDARVVESTELRDTLDLQAARLNAQLRSSSEARQQLQADLKAQLKQVAGSCLCFEYVQVIVVVQAMLSLLNCSLGMGLAVQCCRVCRE